MPCHHLITRPTGQLQDHLDGHQWTAHFLFRMKFQQKYQSKSKCVKQKNVFDEVILFNYYFSFPRGLQPTITKLLCCCIWVTLREPKNVRAWPIKADLGLKIIVFDAKQIVSFCRTMLLMKINFPHQIASKLSNKTFNWIARGQRSGFESFYVMKLQNAQMKIKRGQNRYVGKWS